MNVAPRIGPHNGMEHIFDIVRPMRTALAGAVGGLAGASTAVVATELIKRILAVVSGQQGWWLIVAPLAGLAVAVAVLQSYRQGQALQTMAPEPVHRPARRRWGLNWRDPRDVIRADLTADVLATVGEEERFPWRLAPIRAVAILCSDYRPHAVRPAAHAERPALEVLRVAIGSCGQGRDIIWLWRTVRRSPQ